MRPSRAAVLPIGILAAYVAAAASAHHNPAGERSPAAATWAGGPASPAPLLPRSLSHAAAFAAAAQVQTLATVTTDRSDYPPGTTVVITGSGWLPGETVELTLHEVLEEPVHPDLVLYAVADQNGTFVNSEFAPDDHDVGVTFILTAVGLTSGYTARTSFTDAVAANIDQCRNGPASAPNDCVALGGGTGWVNGNANGTQAHFIEGYSIPYRVRMTELPANTMVEIDLGYDIKHSGGHAIDFLTHFQRLESHLGFGHPAETVVPLSGVTGVSALVTTFPIPAPSSFGSPAAGQPTTRFNSLPAGERVMTLYGGTITNVEYVSEGSLTDSQAETVIRVTFQTDSATAVLAWGGHIGRSADWGAGNSASGISGSPYHMRLKDWNLSNLGNQDRSLSADAVFPTGRIVIVKEIVSGGDNTFSFQPAFNGDTDGSPAPIPGSIFTLTTVSGTASTSFEALAARRHTFTESAPPTGWVFDSLSCSAVDPTGGEVQSVTSVSGQTATVDLGENDTVTCTFRNREDFTLTRGRILVDKVTVPAADSASFSFDTTGSGYNSFSLTDAAPPNNSGFLVPGAYTVSEVVPAGWDLTGVTCAVSGTGGSTPSTSGATATIQLAAGDTVTCTYTNTKRGHIIVDKITVPSGDPQSFSFDAGGGTYADFSLTDAAAPNDQALAPGVYSVSETVPAGWDLTSATCSDGSLVSAIDLGPGETVTCTFTNRKRGSIVVDKVTDPSGDAQSFTFTTTGTGYSGFSLTDAAAPNSQLLAPGAYSVAETVPAGWDLTSATCASSIADTEVPGAIELDAGETVTCTFTNTKRGRIIVDKVTDPSGASQSFAFDAGGGTYADFSLTDAAAPNSQELAPGVYSVSETVPAGWDLTSATCSDGSAPGAIALAAGETVTCTFRNTQRGRILIDKVTNPSGDPQSFSFTASYNAGGFSLTDAAPPNDSGPLAPGTYSVAEVVPGLWDLTSATCSDGSAPGTIALAAGETVTCTFTNTKRGTIIVVKQTDPDAAPGTFTFTGHASGTIADGGSIVVANLVPGIYTSTEVDPAPNFDLVSIACVDSTTQNSTGSLTTRTATFNLQAGEAVTCVFTNRQRGKAGVIKTVSGAALSGTDSFTFQLREGATSTTTGTTLQTQVADAANGGTFTFTTMLVPGNSYQLCEIVMPGWQTNIGTLVPGQFMPPDGVAVNPNVDNSIVCVPFTVTAGETKVFTVDNTPPPGGQARTIGFWKNWASCSGSRGNQAPVLDQTLALSGGVLIGDLLVDTCAEAVAILNKTTVTTKKKMASDPAFNLAAQLLAAKLSILAGAGVSPCAAQAVNSAQVLLSQIDFNGVTHLRMSATQVAQANNLESILNLYNNNLLVCAP
jgi:hypothetical protein